MILIENIRTKKQKYYTDKAGEKILNNDSLSSRFKFVKQINKEATPPEVLQKVSITQKTQEVKTRKSNKNADR